MPHLKLYSEYFAQFEGQPAIIYIYHKIYGTQPVKVKHFQSLCAENKVGFIIRGREIFLYQDEIESISLDKNILKINGILRGLEVKLIK